MILLATPSSNGNYQNNKIIKIAGDNNYPPYEFMDENGVYRGFNVDMMRAIAIEQGLEIEFIPMSWQEAMEALEKGEVDAVQGMTRSKSREEKFDFTLPIITNSQAIFVLEETNYISSVEDLKGRRVSFQEGDISYELSLEVEGINSYIRTNQEEAIDLLLEGKVDAFMGNRLTGIYYLQREGNFDKVKIVGEPMYETEYCISVANGNQHLLELFNYGIEAINKNGTYDKIYKKWFGETFVDRSRYFKNLLYISMTILFAVSILALVNLYWNKNLKKKVEERTGELNTLNKELEEQKREIEKSNKLKGKILESILSGIIVFDNYDRLIEYNKAAERILNKKLCLAEYWTNLKLEEEYGLKGYDVAKKGKVATGNKKIITNNKELYINYNFIPINKPGEGIILLINDLTDIKKYEEMASYNDKMQALGQLSAGIAHEIRNPLTSINTFIDLIPYKLQDEQFRKELVTITKKEINRMNELITQLIDYTKPAIRQPTSFYIHEVLEEVLILFSNQCKKNRIQIVKDMSRISVFADRNQIKQVLVNIILNSIESIEGGGEIRISTLKGDTAGSIVIKDNGCGIAQEHINKIFQPFFTLKPHGTGIGLAITRKLVEENKGNISIESHENRGTTMTVSLPLS